MPLRRKTPRSATSIVPAESLDNLQMRGDRLKVYSLQTLLTNKRSKETRETAKLGEVLLPWFEKMVNKPAQKLDGVLELWIALAPTNLKDRSRLIGFTKGTLTIALESTTTRSELDARLRSGLLHQLQTGSKGAIYRVKTCVQPVREL
jgi:hypothetical protein